MTPKLKFGVIAIAAAAAIALPALVSSRRSDAEPPSRVPAALVTEPARTDREVAVLAGGCFWGVEAVYEHVKGVIDVRSGYAGGNSTTADYASEIGRAHV